MKKIIIWGTSKKYDDYFYAIKYLEMRNIITVVGVTSSSGCYSILDGYPFYPKNYLPFIDFDYLVVAAGPAYSDIVKEAEEILEDRGKSNKIINASVLNIPNLDLEQYIRVRDRNVSIFSNACSGGMLSHYLGLRFNSPTINMWESDDDFLKLMENLDDYLEMDLEFVKELIYEFEGPQYGTSYPLCRLNDIFLHCNHYKDYFSAKKKWDQRIQRVNYDDIFVLMYSENENIVKRFTELPFNNKKIFTNVFLDHKDIVYVSPEYEKEEPYFNRVVNGMLTGKIKGPDVLSLLEGEVKYKRTSA